MGKRAHYIYILEDFLIKKWDFLFYLALQRNEETKYWVSEHR